MGMQRNWSHYKHIKHKSETQRNGKVKGEYCNKRHSQSIHTTAPPEFVSSQLVRMYIPQSYTAPITTVKDIMI